MMIDPLVHDTRSALRHLRAAPGFSAAALVTLALGIGANTAMFSVLNGLVIRPLPITDPAGLIAVTSRNLQNQPRLTLTPTVTELLREGPFRDVCAINGGGIFAADVAGSPTQSVIALVSGHCFDVFGVAPMIGRAITDEDAPIAARGNRVAVIGHRFWTRMFGADPNVTGKTLRMEGEELSVIGVMPAGFDGIQADVGIDVYVPFSTLSPMRLDRPPGASHLLARLKPAVSFEQAAAELDARWPALMQAVVPATLAASERAEFTSARVRVERLAAGVSFYRDRYARAVTIIFGLTSLLLLIACINLGGLLLSRLTERGAELSVRLALGASRFRLAQQMLMESVLLSIGGSVIAVPVALACVQVLASFVPTPLVERSVSFAPDAAVLVMMAVAGGSAAVLISAVPIALAWRRQGAVATAWERTIAGTSNRWARALLIAQVALSVVMLTGAGLLIRSLYLLQAVPSGVDAERLLNVRIMPLPNAYRTIENATYFPALADRIQALPGVRSVGFARAFPRLVTESLGQPIAFVGEDFGDARAQLESASPGFFETVGVPLLRGRYPAWTDDSKSQQVALVSDSLARKLSPTGDVVGRRVKFGSDRAHQDVVIVGVVGNLSLGSLRQAQPPVCYRPTLQAGLFANYPNLVVAANGDPMALALPIRAVLKEMGREYAHDIRTVQRVFREAPSGERMSATLAGMVGALAVLLAFIGVYGLLAYTVARRTREIGIRVALGAGRARVINLVMRDGLMLTALGTAIGLPSAVAAAQVLRSLMFGLSETDPWVLGAITLFFLALGVVAGTIPARRAASVDPAIALRVQ